jgi:hypothetical protein
MLYHLEAAAHNKCKALLEVIFGKAYVDARYDPKRWEQVFKEVESNEDL